MSELSLEMPDRASAPAATRSAASDRLTAMQLLMFGFPALPHAFVALPLFVVLPSFYAAHTAVTLAQIATIAGFSRIFDALSDPIVGFLSDRTRSRLGPRKPWMLGVVLVCPLAIFYLFQPPADATATYFAVWSFVLYVGFTMFEIPRQAWSADLSRDYIQRSRISMYIAVFNIAGSLVFWLLPLALSRFTGTTEITGSTLSGISWLYLICLPLGLLLTVMFVPAGPVVLAPLASGAGTTSSLADLLRSFRRCRPLWRYLGVIGCWGLGQGAFLSTIYIFINDYMGLSAQFAMLMILFFIVQLAALPVWSRVLRRFDRHHVWAFALGADVIARMSVLLLPTGAEHPWPMVLMVACSAFLAAPCVFLPGAVLGDVVDYDHMKTGVKKAGNFFALNTVIIKVAMAIGGSVAFGLLALTDYKVGAKNDAHAQLGLLVAYLGFPAVMGLLGMVLGWTFPITSAHQRTVRRRLERRAALA